LDERADGPIFGTGAKKSDRPLQPTVGASRKKQNEKGFIHLKWVLRLICGSKVKTATPSQRGGLTAAGVPQLISPGFEEWQTTRSLMY
jgi:hypothetical protein